MKVDVVERTSYTFVNILWMLMQCIVYYSRGNCHSLTRFKHACIVCEGDMVEVVWMVGCIGGVAKRYRKGKGR